MLVIKSLFSDSEVNAINKVLGTKIQDRFRKQEEIYKELGLKATFKLLKCIMVIIIRCLMRMISYFQMLIILCLNVKEVILLLYRILNFKYEKRLSNNRQPFKNSIMGRNVGFEPTRAGATIRCVNHFTNSAIT